MPARLLLPGLAALLGAALAAEWLAPAAPYPLERPLLLVRPQPAAAQADDRWAGTVLARPLFSPSRRPDIVAGGAGSPLARLSAIIIGRGGRSAIFAPAVGKPQIVPEGGMIEGYRLTVVRADSVELSAPGATLVLQPQFPATPAAAPAAAAPAAAVDIDNEN